MAVGARAHGARLRAIVEVLIALMPLQLCGSDCRRVGGGAWSWNGNGGGHEHKQGVRGRMRPCRGGEHVVDARGLARPSLKEHEEQRGRRAREDHVIVVAVEEAPRIVLVP